MSEYVMCTIDCIGSGIMLGDSRAVPASSCGAAVRFFAVAWDCSRSSDVCTDQLSRQPAPGIAIYSRVHVQSTGRFLATVFLQE